MDALDVIIVGAGAAGIAAGCRLLENNLKNIAILETKNRIGGRIHSFEVDGSFLELGAQWCHGQENNVVYTLTKYLDILSSSMNSYNDYNLYSPTLSIDKNMTDELLSIAYCIEEDEEALEKYSGNFGDYFLSRFNTEASKRFGDDQNKLIKAVCDWYHSLQNCICACPTWFDLSSKGLNTYQKCEGDYYLHFRNKGYKTIFDVLQKKIPDPTKTLPLENKIYLNKTVKNIKWNNKNGVAVQCSDGSSYKAKCVLVTTSLGVLKRVHDKLFTPELPPYKVRTIKGLGFGGVNKIFLKFRFGWWVDDPKGMSILWSDADKAFFSRKFPNLVKDGKSWLEDVSGFFPIDSHSNVLLAWVIGDQVGFVENLPDDVVVESLMAVLQYYVGHKYKIPNPLSVLSSRWLSDPDCYGSYSYRSNASEELKVFAKDLARPICFNSKPVLLFAGEATSDHHYSTVHGAIGTGFREADRIVGFYKNIDKKSKL